MKRICNSIVSREEKIRFLSDHIHFINPNKLLIINNQTDTQVHRDKHQLSDVANSA